MDYSLLLGIHDVERAEREEEEEEMESTDEEEEEDENGLVPAQGSISPEGISGYMNCFKPMGPGEFDPYIDVYAIQSAIGELFSVKHTHHAVQDDIIHPERYHSSDVVNPSRCSPQGGVLYGSD